MIPTFFGATFLVFIILQMSPGGPLEKTIQQIQRGGAQGGEGGAIGGTGTGGALLPQSAIKELERFYGFDKPIFQRYLIWLGVWPREIKHRNLKFGINEIEKKKNMGKRRFAYIKKMGQNFWFMTKKAILARFGKPNSIWSFLMKKLHPLIN